jgi:hypothetical protein
MGSFLALAQNDPHLWPTFREVVICFFTQAEPDQPGTDTKRHTQYEFVRSV